MTVHLAQNEPRNTRNTRNGRCCCKFMVSSFSHVLVFRGHPPEQLRAGVGRMWIHRPVFFLDSLYSVVPPQEPSHRCLPRIQDAHGWDTGRTGPRMTDSGPLDWVVAARTGRVTTAPDSLWGKGALMRLPPGWSIPALRNPRTSHRARAATPHPSLLTPLLFAPSSISDLPSPTSLLTPHAPIIYLQ